MPPIACSCWRSARDSGTSGLLVVCWLGYLVDAAALAAVADDRLVLVTGVEPALAQRVGRVLAGGDGRSAVAAGDGWAAERRHLGLRPLDRGPELVAGRQRDCQAVAGVLD